jgi:hypothetical protein
MSEPPTRFADRGGMPRWPPRRGATATCHRGAHGLGSALAARLLGLSEFGVRLAVPEVLEANRVVEVGLAAPAMPRPVRRLAKVRGCEPLPEGGHAAVLEFEQPLAYADLLQLARPAEL